MILSYRASKWQLIIYRFVTLKSALKQKQPFAYYHNRTDRYDNLRDGRRIRAQELKGRRLKRHETYFK